MANDASRGSYIAVGGEAHDIELSEAPHGYPSEEGTAAAIEDLKEKDEAQVPLSILTLISGFIIPCIWAAGFLYVLRSLLGAYGVLTVSFSWWNARNNTARILGRISAALCGVTTCLLCCAIAFAILLLIGWFASESEPYVGSYYCVSASCGQCHPEPLVVKYISKSTYNLRSSSERGTTGIDVTVDSDGKFSYDRTTGTLPKCRVATYSFT